MQLLQEQVLVVLIFQFMPMDTDILLPDITRNTCMQCPGIWDVRWFLQLPFCLGELLFITYFIPEHQR